MEISWHLSLFSSQPYNAPELRIRRPGDDHEEVHHFPSDDPFFSEVSNLIDVIEDGPNGDRNLILSSYEGRL